MIKYLLLLTFLSIIKVQGTRGQTSELIIMGTLHAPMPNFNPDSLLSILEKLKPDIILMELDSSFFTKDFKLKSAWNENEPLATAKYIDKYPNTLVRPFEFEGRNSYRGQVGISQSLGPTMKLLDSLYNASKLSKRQTRIVKRYKELTDSLNSFIHKKPYFFNNNVTDGLAKKRQFYQHFKIRNVIDKREEFMKVSITTNENERITLREGYNRVCEFWDLRNKTMAKNILRATDLYPNKKIVVLTGFFHRYYLIEELNKLSKNINRVEFYVR